MSKYRMIDKVERGLKQQKLIDAAVEQRYFQRGGRRFDDILRMFDSVIAAAGICREQDFARAQTQPAATREKGERPIITVSEGRLHAGKLISLIDRREELLAASRAEIMTAIEKWKPQSEHELRLVLDAVVGEISEATRKACADMEEIEAKAEAESEAHAKQADNVFALVPNLDEREQVREAYRTGDMKTLEEVISRQPNEVKRKWAALLEKTLAA